MQHPELNYHWDDSINLPPKKKDDGKPQTTRAIADKVDATWGDR